MIKRKALQRLTAMALSLIMVVGMTPVSALTQNAGAEEGSPALEARTETQENGDGLLTAGAGMWVLEQLASGAVSYVGGMAMEEAMGQIFGKPPSEIDALITAFQEIKEDIKQIKVEIEALSAKIDQKTLKDALREYGSDINAYAAVYEHLCASQLYCKGKPAMTTEFLMELYDVVDPNFKVDGKGIIEATLSLGKSLTEPFKGSNYNPFGAFDLLDKFSNRWEHQGYAQRKAFRGEALYTYTMFSTMAKLACETALADKSKTDLQREKARQWLKQLREDAARIVEMQKRCAVIEHSDLRIYRDTKLGKDLYYFKKEVQLASSYQPGDPAFGKYISTIDGFRAHGILLPMARTSNFNREDFWYGFSLSSQQPSRYMYEKLFNDYKADYGKEVGLYHIFFDANKGAFTSPGAYPGIRFATNVYSYSGFGSPLASWQAQVMSNSAEFDRVALISAIMKSDKTMDHIQCSTEKFYSPAYYYGKVNQGLLQSPEEEPTPEPADQISGMAPYYDLPHAESVTLSVYGKPGYACQWYVKTGEDGYLELPGETGTSYTLPELTASMNGFRYICGFIPDSKLPDDYLSTAPVTLDLYGEGVTLPETVHLVHNAEDLEAALEKVSDSEWDGHMIKLAASIEYPKPIALLDRTLTIDLNGYTLLVSPASDAQPNVNPESTNPEVAAVYLASNSVLATMGDGDLNILADGAAYGVYAEGGSSAAIGSVRLRGGGTAVHASNHGSVTVSGYLQAEGDQAVGAACVDGGHISILGDITVSGEAAYGTFISSSNLIFSDVTVAGTITVSGQNSRGAYLDAETAKLTVNGNVMVNDGLTGVSASQGQVTIHGSVTAPDSAINARDGAIVHVYGDVSSTGMDAAAVSVFGASLQIGGNVTSSRKGGTGIAATAWALADPALGAQVTVDGIISASTPLRIESLPIEESGYAEPSSKPDYHTYTDGTSTVWAKSGSFEIPVFYTLTVNPNGGTASGGGQYAQGTAVSISAGSRSGYSFDGWHSDNGGSFADGNSASTAFTMPANHVTVTAIWRYRGGDDSSPVTPTAPEKRPGQPVTAEAPVIAAAGANETAGASVSDKAITDAIAKAQADAKAQGSFANGIAVALNIAMPQGATSLTATLTQSSLNSLVSAGVSQLEINGAPVSLSLDLNALKEIQKQSSGDISISFTPATGLSKAAKALLGNRPVYNIAISHTDEHGNTQNIFGLGSGTAALSIPYTPNKNEAVGYLFGVYVDAQGNAARIPGSIYDANSRSLLLGTNHFSVYGVGYEAPSAKFIDIGSHWAKGSIDYVVGRGLFSGTSKTTFAPGTAMTRAMLVTALGRLAGVDTKAYTKSSFTDVKADSLFRPYIEWAYGKGIVQGTESSRFAPDGAITREEIAVIIANFAKATGYKLPVVRTAAAFADASGIGISYEDAVMAMQQAGIMMGETDNKFNPKASATRAEVSAMLHRYIKLTIDPAAAQGWANNDDGRYMYYKDGMPLTGWQTIDGAKYFFNTDGTLKTGWVKDGGNWRYYSGNEAAVSWLEIGGKWYYFNADGSLAKSTQIDGYQVDENGVRKSK